jgi:hypothetical protein
MASITMPGGDWQVASDLPGRLRVRHASLLHSPQLRHHCYLVLTSCHWLVRFRINGLAGSVCIEYPRHRRRELTNLLQALTLSREEQSYVSLPRPRYAGRQVRRTIAHGLTCATLLALDSLLAVPPVAMASLTAVLLWPLAREVIEQLRRRELSVESLELSFSAVLVTQGLSAEALLDQSITDAVVVAQSTIEPEDLSLDAHHLLKRLGDGITLCVLDPSGQTQLTLLRDVSEGMRIQISDRQHCFLTARLEVGELIVVNRLVDGDWRPRRLVRGDAIEPGAMVIAGSAEATIRHCIHTEQAYGLLRENQNISETQAPGPTSWINGYKRVMAPLLLALGGTLLATGSGERALAAFQFNPVSDWENQNLAAQLTALADLNLHQLQIRNTKALETIGNIRHLVISRSCLDRIGGIQVREHIHPDAAVKSGSLVQLLAGIQRWICGVDGTSIWSLQLQNVSDAVPIRHVDIRHLLEGWRVEAEDGRQWFLKQQSNFPGGSPHTHLNALDIWQDDVQLGTVELLSEPDAHWLEACQSLRALGVTLHLVSSNEASRLDDVGISLGIAAKHRHGRCNEAQRLELVQALQQRGEAVGYVGYVLHDLPALAQADVSIGLDVDDDSRYLSRICDLSLGADAHWLPRLINMSRAMQRSGQQNFVLLGASQALSSLATFAGLISPLQTVLLGDLPLLLAEVNNVLALSTKGNQGTHKADEY